MCFSLIKDSARLKKNLRRRKKPIVAYKVLKSNLRTPFRMGYKWNFGPNTSSREMTKLTLLEIKVRAVFEGFHFHKDIKQAIIQRNNLTNFNNEKHSVYKVLIEPEDIVAVNKIEIVATKATLGELCQE